MLISETLQSVVGTAWLAVSLIVTVVVAARHIWKSAKNSVIAAAVRR